MNSPQLKYKYVYDLPYLSLRNLARILDDNYQWKELGGCFMNYDITTLNEFGRTTSPTETMLANWGQKNHTILELFCLLLKMQHFRALEILKTYVDEKFHTLYGDGQENTTKLTSMQLNTVEPAAAANPYLIASIQDEGAYAVKPEVDSCNLDKSGTGRMLESKLGSLKLTNVGSPLAIPTRSNQRDLPSKSEINQAQASWNGSPGARSFEQPQHHLPVINRREQPRRDSESSAFSELSSASAMANIPPIDEIELAAATNLWNSACILGRGGFGTVYKGNWKNTQVAIKRMENKGEAGANLNLQQSMGELRILYAIRHDNILPLYGYSLDGTFPCLLYQYMPNGSLEDRLLCRQGTYPINWEMRLNIGRGTARGLQFLHTIKDKPLIHCDIKSANILLDKNFEPKIGDFGLAREGPQTQYTHMKVSHVHGTRPYLPDEYLRGRKISTKVDTYSYGIVLFELGTGLRAYDSSRPQCYAYLRDFVENNDKMTMRDVKAGDDYLNIYVHIMAVGSTCAKSSAKERPEMVQVLKNLDDLALQTEPFSNHHQWLLTHHPSRPMPISVSSNNRTLSPREVAISPRVRTNDDNVSIAMASPVAAEESFSKLDSTSSNADYMPAFSDLMSSKLNQSCRSIDVPDLNGLMATTASSVIARRDQEESDSDSDSSESISSSHVSDEADGESVMK